MLCGRQRGVQTLDATLSRLITAAAPLLDRKGYKVVLVREPLVPRLAPAGTSDGDLTT